jgi:hypothetical protein
MIRSDAARRPAPPFDTKTTKTTKDTKDTKTTKGPHRRGQ